MFLASRIAPVSGAVVLPLFLALGSLPACGLDSGNVFEDGETEPAAGDLRFAHEGTLELSPQQQVTVEILGSAGSKVSVLLLGDAQDASLDQPSVQADTDGVARVVLRAPSKPSTFRLRAQVPGAHAELSVSVSEFGFATIAAVPRYVGGREIDGWAASVSLGTSCQEVLALLPQDPAGALTATSTKDGSPTVGSVPVGPKLVVALRSGGLMAGCSEVTLDKPGVLREVSIDVLDIPIALGDARFDAALGFSPDEQAYVSLLAEASSALADLAFPPGTPTATTLLDQMQQLLPVAAQSAFASHRQQQGLDASVGASLAGFEANAFCLALGDSGRAAALSALGTEASEIRGRLTGDPYDPSKVSLLVTDWQGASGTDLGLSQLAFTWSTQPGDKLSLIGSVPLHTTRLAGHFMTQAAASEHAPATTAAEALIAALDCEAIGALSAFAGCDATCAADLCDAAVQARWQRGLAGEGLALGSLAISLSADVELDKTVVPVGFSGSWVGTLDGLGQQGAVSGAAEGTAPPPR